MEQKEYESIKKKILKLYALAERGVGGEAVNARRLLEQWLNRYGIRLADILAEENEKQWYEIKGANQEHYRKLLFNCYAKVTNRTEVTYKKTPRGKKRIWLELTAYQYAELSAMFEWHKARLDKEMKRLKDEATSAFIQKHNLFPETDNENDENIAPLTPAEMDRLRRVFSLMEGMDNESYVKMLPCRE